MDRQRRRAAAGLAPFGRAAKFASWWTLRGALPPVRPRGRREGGAVCLTGVGRGRVLSHAAHRGKQAGDWVCARGGRTSRFQPHTSVKSSGVSAPGRGTAPSSAFIAAATEGDRRTSRRTPHPRTPRWQRVCSVWQQSRQTASRPVTYRFLDGGDRFACREETFACDLWCGHACREAYGGSAAVAARRPRNPDGWIRWQDGARLAVPYTAFCRSS